MIVKEGEIYINKKSRIFAITSESQRWVVVMFNDSKGLYRYARKIFEKSDFRLITDKYLTWQEAISSPEFRGE